MTQKQDYAQRLLQRADALETRAQIIRRVVANCNDNTSDEVRRLILNNERLSIEAELTFKALSYHYLKEGEARRVINTLALYHNKDELAKMISSFIEQSERKGTYVSESEGCDVAKKLLTRKIATQEEYDDYTAESLKKINRIYEPKMIRCPSSFL